MGVEKLLKSVGKNLSDGSKFINDFASNFNSKGIDPIETMSDFYKKGGEKAGKKAKAKINKKAYSERGLHGVKKALGEDKSIGEAFKHAYTKEDNKHIAASTILGSYAAVNSGARLLGGGGLYKDHNGNTDIVGLPFI